MEQFLCITLRQDVPDFNNITKVKEGRNLFICESNYKFWSEITPRFLTVELEAKEIPSRVIIQLHNFSLKQSGPKRTTSVCLKLEAESSESPRSLCMVVMLS